MNINDILIEPVITEKSTSLKPSGVYTFIVRKEANKLLVMNAVKSIFKVEVEDCRIINKKPKIKMLRTRKGVGKTKSFKKAMVKLKKGVTIAELEA